MTLLGVKNILIGSILNLFISRKHNFIMGNDTKVVIVSLVLSLIISSDAYSSACLYVHDGVPDEVQNRCDGHHYYGVYRKEQICDHKDEMIYSIDLGSSESCIECFFDFQSEPVTKDCVPVAYKVASFVVEYDFWSFECDNDNKCHSTDLAENCDRRMRNRHGKEKWYYACYDRQSSPPPGGCVNECGAPFVRDEGSCACICNQEVDDCHYVTDGCEIQEYIPNVSTSYEVGCDEVNEKPYVTLNVEESLLRIGEIGEGKKSGIDEYKCVEVEGKLIELTALDNSGGPPMFGHVGYFSYPYIKTLVISEPLGNFYSIRADWDDPDLWWFRPQNLYIEPCFDGCILRAPSEEGGPPPVQ